MRTACAAVAAAMVCAYWLAAAAHGAAPPALVRRESKRDVADKLILLAEEHKELSLHDVLEERVKQLASSGTRQPAAVDGARKKNSRKRPVSVVRERLVRRPDGRMDAEVKDASSGQAFTTTTLSGDAGRPEATSKVGGAAQGGRRSSASRSGSNRRSEGRGGSGKRQQPRKGTAKRRSRLGEHVVVNTWSEQIGRDANATVRHSELAAYVNTSAMVVSAVAAVVASEQNMPVLRRPTDFAAALFGGIVRHPLAPAMTPGAGLPVPISAPVFAALDGCNLDDDEAGVMLRALRVLEASPVDEVDARVKALLILEEVRLDCVSCSVFFLPQATVKDAD